MGSRLLIQTYAILGLWTVSLHVQAASLSCTLWNTEKFFEAAGPKDITRCLDAGIDVNARTPLGLTPLHMAAKYGNSPDIVAPLVSAGFKPDDQAKDGWTALHVAASYAKSPELVEAIIEAITKFGGDIDVRTYKGFTPLHLAAGLNKEPGIVNILIKHGADLSSRADFGLTPLHMAAGYSTSPQVVAKLLDKGASLAAKAELGLTPFHWAAAYAKTPEVLSEFLKRGKVDIDFPDASGLTPLHWAAHSQNIDAIDILLTAGADPKIKSSEGQLPWDYIKDNPKLENSQVYWKLKEGLF